LFFNENTAIVISVLLVKNKIFDFVKQKTSYFYFVIENEPENFFRSTECFFVLYA